MGNPKKTLYFYSYVPENFNENLAVKCHTELLKRYCHVFDEFVFMFAGADTDDKKSEAGKFVENTIGKKNVRIMWVENDMGLYEVRQFIDVVLKKMNGEPEYVFWAHMKGITNVEKEKNVESILRWIISLYYFSLEDKYVAEMEDSFRDGRITYGSLLTHYKRRMNSHIQNHNKIYIGGIYWLNLSKKYDFDKDNIDNKDTRYYAENFPMIIQNDKKGDLITGHNDVIVEGSESNAYGQGHDRWKRLWSFYDDPEGIDKLQEEVLKTLGLTNK